MIKVKVPKPLQPILENKSISNFPVEKKGPSLQVDKIQEDDGDTENVHGLERAPEVVTIANFTQYCAPVTSRGLFWNWTIAGDTAVMQCPVDSTGFAKWRCSNAAGRVATKIFLKIFGEGFLKNP